MLSTYTRQLAWLCCLLVLVFAQHSVLAQDDYTSPKKPAIKNTAALGDGHNTPKNASAPSNKTPRIKTTAADNTLSTAENTTAPDDELDTAITAPDVENPFQTFLSEGGSPEISTELSIFGQQLFQQAPSTFAPINDMPVPADYVLGPGDEVLLRAWGQVDIDYQDKIDRNGNIAIPTIGSVHLAGIKYNDLRAYLRRYRR